MGLADPGLMTGGGQGTGVPGVTSGVPTPGGYGIRYFRNEALSDRLGDLEIPDDEVDNYVETLEAGRSVVAYFAKADTIDKVTEIFHASGSQRSRRLKLPPRRTAPHGPITTRAPRTVKRPHVL